MGEIGNLEPKEVFEYFEQIVSIPRPSFHEDKIRDFLVDFAKSHNLEYYADDKFNVVIKKNATNGYEDADGIILQGHTDMVCVNEEEKVIDYLSEGIKAYVEDGYIKAEGTSLGADNGIAVSMMLGILASDDIPHPYLECVFTSCEEVGLEGAYNLDVDLLKSRKMINLDSEEEENLIVGCAGGVRCFAQLPVKRKIADGIEYEIVVSGLSGGHSGVDIIKEGANANYLMGRILREINKALKFALFNFQGGLRDNVICDRAFAKIIVQKSSAVLLESIMPQIAEEISKEYEITDPGLTVTLTNVGEKREQAISAEDLSKTLLLINLIPNGIVNMCSKLENMVETSLNLGMLELLEDSFMMTYLVRSSVESRLKDVTERIETICDYVGAKVSYSGKYPGWEVKQDSELRDDMVRIYKEVFGREVFVESIHAGLECGVFVKRIPNLDAVSIGPDMMDVHSVNERLSIDSVGRMWDYLKKVLAVKR